MKKSFIFFASVLLLFMTGCNDLSEEDQKVRENVWSYVKATDMPVDEEWESAWLNGEIEEIEVSEDISSFSGLDEKYLGQTVLLVTPVFETERIAYPSILVDSETKEVIGELPGE